MFYMKNIYSAVSAVLICLVLVCTAGCISSSGQQSSGTQVNIVLSDTGVIVDGTPISTDTASPVYAGADIIYYEEGHDSSYGEGTAADGHSAAEAAAHTVITITQPGVYHLSGTLSAGQIAVDLGDTAQDDPAAVVELILDGVTITNTVAPAVLFYNVYETHSTESAGAVVTLADDSVNIIHGSYVARIYQEGTTKKLHKYDGAFYSRMSMLIQGNGTLNITAENEGLDSEMHLIINGGTIRISSQDDGINTNEDGVSVTVINGGDLYINAGLGSEGDGIDSNGDLIINGGTIITMANGRSGDGGIDADGEILINGGTVIALGSRNDAVSSASGQPYMELSYAATKDAGTSIRITDGNGSEILTFTPEKIYQSFTFSSPELKEGEVYQVYSDGILQQYTGNTIFGMGMPGGGQMSPGENRQEMMQTPPEMPDGEKMGNPPEIPDGGQMPPGDNQQGMMQTPQEMTGTVTQEIGQGSTEFILTATTHSFSGVSDSPEASGKTTVVFHVNENDLISDTPAGESVEIVYAGAALSDGTLISLAPEDIQFTLTDVPSESYQKTVRYSDGAAALTAILPTDAGTYQLIIAISNPDSVYTGSSVWTFHIT